MVKKIWLSLSCHRNKNLNAQNPKFGNIIKLFSASNQQSQMSLKGQLNSTRSISATLSKIRNSSMSQPFFISGKVNK